MIIPWEQLPAATLDNLIESFVLREGTDYGEQTFTLAEKVEHVRQQLQRGREHQFLPQRQLVSQRFLVGSRKRQHLAQQQCGRQFLPQQFREQLSQQCFL